MIPILSREEDADATQGIDPRAAWLALEAVDAPVLWVEGRSRRVCEANAAACRMVGLPRERLRNQLFEEVTGCPLVTGRHAVRTRNGDASIWSHSNLIVSQVSGEPDLWMAIARLEADRIAAPRRTGGGEDELTELPLRSAAFARVRELLAGTGRPAVLFIDLDDFKRINDRHGHLVGDRVLVIVARRLSNCLRPADLLSRYGGDEFLAVLEDADPIGAEGVRQRMERAVRRPCGLVKTTNSPSIAVSASVGLAMRRDGDNVETLIARADADMYARKRERQRQQH